MSAQGAMGEAIDDLEVAGDSLRARAPEEVAEALIEAWARIADPERALGRRARVELPTSTGLTLPMVAWALATTFDGQADAIRDAVRRMRPPHGCAAAPHRFGALVLAGNVFTASVRPLTFALLARVPVLVKASSKDDALPRLFADALSEVDEGLAAACKVVTFPGGTDALEATLLSRAAVVSAYGSDATVRSIRARLAPGATLLGHGHGLGVGLVTAGALEPDPEDVARRFALDVAAYDQRGCLSPHAILVDAPVPVVEGFGRRLHEALDELEAELPRGALPTQLGPAQIRWRGLAATRGPLFEGRASAVAVDEAGGAIRPSPGWRNVLVVRAGPEEARRHLDALGGHLKALGVAGDRDAVMNALPPSVAPRVCGAGRMQRPGLSTPSEGRLPWEGFVRWVAVDAEDEGR